jgi:hypothetical protein
MYYDAQVHVLLNDEQLGKLTVEDGDAARLAIARALGQPEPVLYEDEDDNTPAGEDYERVLLDLVDLQERMACGMKMIQQASDVLNDAARGKRLPYNIYISWVERKKALWSHWWHLKSCCDALVDDDRWLWYQYFQLAEEDITDRFCYGETDMVDDMVNMWLPQSEQDIDPPCTQYEELVYSS